VIVGAGDSYRTLRARGLSHGDAVEALRFRRFLEVIDAAPIRNGMRVVAPRWIDYAYPPGHPSRDDAMAGWRAAA
jgi:hypothetical protein